MTLENTGERQVSPNLDGIRRDHVARYEFAAAKLQKGSQVIDFACGIGYGCRILNDAGHVSYGYDIDDDALAYADEHYAKSDGIFIKGNGNDPGILGQYDAAISFETIEHLQDPRPLLLALRESAPLLICSVPNEDVMPYEYAPGQTYAFHYRHYTKAQFNALLQECGWCAVEWYGQEGPESEVELGNQGRTLIAVCMRDELLQQADTEEKHVAILGLGPSIDQYLEITKRLGGRSRFCDETWAINALGNVFDCDLIFHMDDVRIQEIRAKAAPASNIAAMLNWLKTSQVPVITSRAHPDYPNLVEFPLEDVLNTFGQEYFNSTAAYAVAYAIWSGATKISLFGMDYTYPNVHDAEKGRACVEFWIGVARAHGIDIKLPKTTSLMDAMYPREARLYGYDCVDVAFNSQADGTVKLAFTERETLPTAEEIERNYDHSAPIAKQHLPIT
jgi:SAM-dependent methyltransferase